MVDITKCKGGYTPRCLTCRRYLVKAWGWQSWANFIPKSGGKCIHYLKGEKHGRKS